MDFRNVDILPQHYRCHNPEDLYLSLHRHESLKPRIKMVKVKGKWLICSCA